MRRMILPLLGLLLVAATPVLSDPAAAAEIPAGFSDYLRTLGDNQPVSVLCFMRDQAPIAELDQALKQAGASRAERHERVVRSLQQVSHSQDDLLAHLQAHQASGEVTSYTSYWITNVVVLQATAGFVRELAEREDLAAIEPNFTISRIEPVREELRTRPALRHRGAHHGIRGINADRAWYELGATGYGRLVANLDTGVDAAHDALGDRWRGNFHPWEECWLDYLGGSSFPYDDWGHGTRVMGNECGLGAPTQDSVGVAWSAQWIAANGAEQDYGPDLDNATLAALQWFADPDGNPGTVDDVPDVVQNSWGINESCGYDYVDCDARWNAAIDNLEAAGCVTIWSAGNSGLQGPMTIWSPADRIASPVNTLAVGAVETYGYEWPFPIWNRSSRGPSGCDEVTIKPEVVAPGVLICSCIPGVGYMISSGTSFAGPHVAGIVALMREVNPDLDADAIKQILIDTARDLGNPGEDNDYGWGCVDAYEAVLAAIGEYGTLTGFVGNGSNGGSAIAGAMIETDEIMRRGMSRSGGTYQMVLPPGTYTVTASHGNFTPETVYGVVIDADSETIQDFSLNDVATPEMATLDLRSTDDTVGPYLPETMISDDSAIDQATLHYRVDGGAFTAVPMTPTDATSYTGEIPGQPMEAHIEYYVEAIDVAGNGALDPPGAPEELFDFHIAPYYEIFSDDVESGQGEWTHGPITDGWYSQWHLETYRNHTPGGEVSWKCGSDGDVSYWGQQHAGLVCPPFELRDDSYLHYWQYMDAESSNACPAHCWDGGLAEIRVDGGEWEQIFPDGGYPFIMAGTAETPVPAGTSMFSGLRDWHEVHFSLGAYSGTAQIRFGFYADRWIAAEGWYVDDIVIDGFEFGPSAVDDPPQVRLVVCEPADPNPFSAATHLRYRLPVAADVLVQICDPTGRVVRTLIAARQTAGTHALTWDGRDADARTLPSGVYLSRFIGGGQKITQKLVLTR